VSSFASFAVIAFFASFASFARRSDLARGARWSGWPNVIVMTADTSAAGRFHDDSFFAEAAFLAFELMFCGLSPAAVVAYKNKLFFHGTAFPFG
jgi:hypothetical protein